LILVLEGGRIVERGTHAQLLQADGSYRRIHDIQLRIDDAVEEEISSVGI
jgi:ATP-binding cassette subfamily B protein